MSETTTRNLAEAYKDVVREVVRKGQASLKTKQKVQSAFADAMKSRVAKMVAKKRDEQIELQNSYFVGYDKLPRKVGESFGDFAKVVAKGALRAVGRGAADGLTGNPDSFAGVEKALTALRKKKKTFDVSKAPKTTTSSARRKRPSSAMPTTMTRQDLSKHLQNTGNRLDKVSLSDEAIPTVTTTKEGTE
jgi:hypothetical protein